MIGIEVNLSPNFARKQRRLLDVFVEQVMQDAQDIARQRTPVKSGALRNAWKELGSGIATTIVNDKSYAKVIDKGRHMTGRGMRGSVQAPRGITGPTIKEIRRIYK